MYFTVIVKIDNKEERRVLEAKKISLVNKNSVNEILRKEGRAGEFKDVRHSTEAEINMYEERKKRYNNTKKGIGNIKKMAKVWR